MKRDYTLDIVRCGMNYMIVVLHAWAAYQYVKFYTLEFWVWTFICNHLCAIALPTFFLISGYLFFSNFSVAKWPDKMKRRIKRLAVPYLVWNTNFVLFYLALACFVPRISARVSQFGLNSFSGAVSKIVSLTTCPIDGPLWFLRTLFLLSLISPLLWLAIRVGRGYLAIVATCAYFAFESVMRWTGVMGQIFPAYALVCFTAGGVIAANKKNIINVFRSYWWIIVGVFACVVHFVISYISLCKLDAIARMASSLMVILESPLLLSIASHCSFEWLVKSRVYCYLKNMSFFVYAGHFLFCSMFLHALAPRLTDIETGKFTLLVLIFIGCGLPTMAIIYALGRRFLPRFIKLLDGAL